jgi:malate dehydrogenase (oxaloacetate-decarboxylating)
MKIAAAEAIANLVGDKLDKKYIIPDPFDQRVVPAVAFAVAKSAVENNLAKIKITEEEIRNIISKNLK